MLTRRSRPLKPGGVFGLLNKQVAANVHLSEITAAHRGQVTRKLKAGSLADLVRIAPPPNFPLVKNT